MACRTKGRCNDISILAEMAWREGDVAIEEIRVGVADVFPMTGLDEDTVPSELRLAGVLVIQLAKCQADTLLILSPAFAASASTAVGHSLRNLLSLICTVLRPRKYACSCVQDSHSHVGVSARGQLILSGSRNHSLPGTIVKMLNKPIVLSVDERFPPKNQATKRRDPDLR
ncbi:hypothetical protein Y032_0097g2999 [Ancylostoma ceylanicum]|uniref:Uncharacterized protein n=1 Tax=Ancylostoma ceylanicum TaxID=53326 RepID=A0A016TJP8_9BILA|nr:hypothetical protein Y032_0097g2999 [Ancylostoma ceylanicum]